jgi:fibronectin-binding autotransporter adhesin
VSARLALANGGSATLDTVANNVTLANAFGSSKTSSLKKIGAGTLTLSGANTYAGLTTIDAGKLVVSSLGDGVSASSLGTAGLAPANLVLATGVTLGYAGAGETSGRGFTMASSATIDASGAGALAFSSAAKVAFSNSTSARTLTLTGTNMGANIFGAGLLVGATLDEDKVSQVVKDGVGTWIIANGEALKSSAQVDITAGILGVVSQVLRAGNVVTLRNTSTLYWGPGDTDDLSPYIHLASGAAATLNVGANNVTFDQSLAFDGGSAASLTKTGAGTLTLVASNSGITGGFILNQGGVNVLSATGLGSGPTIVNGGVLSVNAATTNNVTVNNSGTIGGSGTIATLSVTSGGHVSPGNSPGTLTVASATTLAGGAVIEWQVMDALDSTKFDHINFGTLNLSGASHANPIIFKVISLANGISGNPLNFSSDDIRTFNLGTIGTLNLGTNANINDVYSFDLSQFTYTEGTLSSAGLWSMSYDSVSGALTLTAVPEPSTYGLSLGALALVGAVIRRRNKTKKCR